jgi:hypothetical protein
VCYKAGRTVAACVLIQPKMKDGVN